MARATAIAVTFSACLVLCSSQLVNIIQEEQPLPGSSSVLVVDNVMHTIEHEPYSNAAQPMIRVTVWSTSGVSARNAWDLLASAVTDPLGWLSTQLDQSALPQPTVQNSADDLNDMLRRISCARMRQAMMEYYNYQQEFNAGSSEQNSLSNMMNMMAQSQMHPGQLSATLDATAAFSDDEDDDKFERASTASLFEFPINTEAMEDSSRSDEDDSDLDETVQIMSKVNMPQSDFLFDQHLDEAELPQLKASSLPMDNALTEKGLKYLSSMLHTISGLLVLQDGSAVSSSNVQMGQPGSENMDLLADAYEESGVVPDVFGSARNAAGGSEEVKGAVMEPENKWAREPFSGTEPQVTAEQQFETRVTDTVPTETQTDFAFVEPAAVSQDDWVEALPPYFTENGGYVEDDLDFDWGLFAFTLLSALCVVVWVVAVRQYVQLRTLFCMQHEHLDLLESEETIMAPLLAKLHDIEIAANHVDPSSQEMDTKTALLKAQYCPHN